MLESLFLGIESDMDLVLKNLSAQQWKWTQLWPKRRQAITGGTDRKRPRVQKGLEEVSFRWGMKREIGVNGEWGFWDRRASIIKALEWESGMSQEFGTELLRRDNSSGGRLGTPFFKRLSHVFCYQKTIARGQEALGMPDVWKSFSKRSNSFLVAKDMWQAFEERSPQSASRWIVPP